MLTCGQFTSSKSTKKTQMLKKTNNMECKRNGTCSGTYANLVEMQNSFTHIFFAYQHKQVLHPPPFQKHTDCHLRTVMRTGKD